MTPQQALRDIVAKHSEVWVLDQLAADGVQVTQPTLNKIRHGDIRRTSYETGEAILRLWKRVKRQKRARTA